MTIERTFIITQDAWYANPKIVGDDASQVHACPEVMIQMTGPAGSGEFAIRWRLDRKAPRLEMFDDAWALIPHFADLFQWLQEHPDQDVTPADVGAALKTMGMQDVTRRQPPKSVVSPTPRRPGARP